MKKRLVALFTLVAIATMGFSQSHEFCGIGKITIAEERMSFYDYKSGDDSLGFVGLVPMHLKILSENGVNKIHLLNGQNVTVWGRFFLSVDGTTINDIDTLVVVMNDPEICSDYFVRYQTYLGKLSNNKTFKYLTVGGNKLHLSSKEIQGFGGKKIQSEIVVFGADSLQQYIGQQIMLAGTMQYVPNYGSQMGFHGSFGAWTIRKMFMSLWNSEFPPMRPSPVSVVK